MTSTGAMAQGGQKFRSCGSGNPVYRLTSSVTHKTPGKTSKMLSRARTREKGRVKYLGTPARDTANPLMQGIFPFWKQSNIRKYFGKIGKADHCRPKRSGVGTSGSRPLAQEPHELKVRFLGTLPGVLRRPISEGDQGLNKVFREQKDLPQ